MAQPLTNILALDFSAATGRGRLLLHGGQVLDRGGIRRPFRQAGRIRLAGANWDSCVPALLLPIARAFRVPPPGTRLRPVWAATTAISDRPPMRDTAKNIDAAKAVHYSNNC